MKETWWPCSTCGRRTGRATRAAAGARSSSSSPDISSSRWRSGSSWWSCVTTAESGTCHVTTRFYDKQAFKPGLSTWHQLSVKIFNHSSFYWFLLTKLPVSEGFTDKCPNFRRETVLKHLLIILSMKNVSTYFIVFSKVCRSQTSHRRLRPSNFSRFTSAPLIQPVFSLVESHITPTGR